MIIVRGRATQIVLNGAPPPAALLPQPIKPPTGAPVPVTALPAGKAGMVDPVPERSARRRVRLHRAGGTLDKDGKTTPRSLRHFPHHKADGSLDLPHLKNALARAPQSDFESNAMPHLEKHAQAESIGERGDDGKSWDGVKIRVSPNRPGTAGMLKRHQLAALKKGERHTPALQKFFDGQAKRVTAKLLAFKRRKAIVTTDAVFDMDDERERLEAVLGPLHMDAVEAGAGAAQVASLGVTVDVDNPRLKAYLGELAKRVVGINDTTRTAIDAQINTGLAKGYSMPQIAQGVEADGYQGIAGVFAQASGYRATMIARTETQVAYNGAAVAAYKEANVSQVEVMDGDYDEMCAERNGDIIDVDDADAMAEDTHPNCLVGASMVVAPNLQATFTRQFDGEVVVLRTAADDLLTCTPNHPVLSDRGWIAAGLLREGDHVLRSLDSERIVARLDPDHDYRPARIEQVADAFRLQAAAASPPCHAPPKHSTAMAPAAMSTLYGPIALPNVVGRPRSFNMAASARSLELVPWPRISRVAARRSRRSIGSCLPRRATWAAVVLGK